MRSLIVECYQYKVLLPVPFRIVLRYSAQKFEPTALTARRTGHKNPGLCVLSRLILRGGNMNIYVGNLSPDVTEDELRQEFTAFAKSPR